MADHPRRDRARHWFAATIVAGVAAAAAFAWMSLEAVTSGGIGHATGMVLRTCTTLPHFLAGSLAVLVVAVAIGAVVLGIARAIAMGRGGRHLAGALRELTVTCPDHVLAHARRQGLGSLQVISHRAPLAVTTGLLRPRVTISTGAIEALADDELAAVLAHEAHHVASRDPLRLLIAGALAELATPFPIVSHLARRLELAIEVAADAAAVRATSAAAVAASLMHFLEPVPDGAAACGIGGSYVGERVDALCGNAPRSSRPARELAASALAVVLIVAVIGALHLVPPMG